MTESKGLFDNQCLALQATRHEAAWPQHPLYQMAQAQLQERLADVRSSFHRRATSTINLTDSYDLILSCLERQTTANDLREKMASAYNSLSTGGLFLGVTTANQALHELRHCLTEAEIALNKGTASRFHPMIAVEDIHAALTSCGFTHQVIDHERVQLVYPTIYALMHDLRACGLTNALTTRPKHFTKRRLFDVANDLYKERFPAPNGGIVATVDLVFLHGWRE